MTDTFGAVAMDTQRGRELVGLLQTWAHGLGFSQIGVADVDLNAAEPGLLAWLEAGFHGQMHYMADRGVMRARPAELVPGTVRVITACMNYLPQETPPDWREREWQRLADPGQAVISIYARGRDYHKVLRQRLARLAAQLAQAVGPLGSRVFTDSAPVLEVELATRSGLGWRGKHTLVLSRERGSMAFLGEIYVDMALPLTPWTDLGADGAVGAQGSCGSCTACITACPTAAIVAPYRLDARRCISYLTIEHDGPIEPALRPRIGNHLYGCDDCQLACPWNKYAQPSTLIDFDARAQWQGLPLPALWAWDEGEFLRASEGSPIRRIGFARWQRNLAVVSGNRLAHGDDGALRAAMAQALNGCTDAVVAEHIAWALAQAPQAH